MIFSKLLKKKTKKLDIPPPPPALDIPPPPEDLDLPELPPLPEEIMSEEKKGTTPEPPMKFPEFPKIEPITEEVMPIKPIPTLPTHEFEPKKKEKKETTVVKEKRFPSVGKDIFVKADQYKEILESVDVTKRKIRESEKILERLNEIKNIKDNEFEKWRTLLEDIERKSVYIDKTLFER